MEKKNESNNAQSIPDRGLLNADQAALYLSISRRMLYNHVSNNLISTISMGTEPGSRPIRFRVVDLDAFVDYRHNKGTTFGAMSSE